jgi:hypothetical protein
MRCLEGPDIVLVYCLYIQIAGTIIRQLIVRLKDLRHYLGQTSKKIRFQVKYILAVGIN